MTHAPVNFVMHVELSFKCVCPKHPTPRRVDQTDLCAPWVHIADSQMTTSAASWVAPVDANPFPKIVPEPAKRCAAATGKPTAMHASPPHKDEQMFGLVAFVPFKTLHQMTSVFNKLILMFASSHAATPVLDWICNVRMMKENTAMPAHVDVFPKMEPHSNVKTMPTAYRKTVADQRAA